MAEQRIFLRKKVPLPLPIELLPGKEVWLDDLGEGGLSVSGSSRLELGTTAFFSFKFPDANTVIDAAGVVAWCDPSGRAGVRFTRIKPDSTAALKRWLKNGSLPFSIGAASIAGDSPEVPPQVPRLRDHIAELRSEIAAASLGTEKALDVVVEHMARLTRASGAAIAWRDGENVICHATRGNAPELGVRLNIGASLTGECYRTGNIVMLADSENDPRVNAEVCRQLDFRSLLIVPIASNGEVRGIAEVFSPVPGNFDGGDVLLLGSISEIIADICAHQRPRELPEVKLAFDVAEVAAQEVRPNAALRPPVTLQSKVETSHTSSQSIRIGNTGGSAVTQRPTSAWAPASRNSVTEAAPLRTQRRSRTYVLVGALLITGGIGIGDYVDWHFTSRVTTRPTNTDKPGGTTLPVAASNSTTHISEEGLATGSTGSTQLLLTAVPAGNEREAQKPSLQVDSVNPKFDREQTSHVESEPAPTATTPPSSRPLTLRVDPVYPQLAELSGPGPQTTPARITAGKLIRRVNPITPEFARNAAIGGGIVLSATIGKDGYLKNVKLVSGNEALATAAFRALREWRYTPYLRDGQPIEAQIRIVMDFGR